MLIKNFLYLCFHSEGYCSYQYKLIYQRGLGSLNRSVWVKIACESIIQSLECPQSDMNSSLGFLLFLKTLKSFDVKHTNACKKLIVITWKMFNHYLISTANFIMALSSYQNRITHWIYYVITNRCLRVCVLFAVITNTTKKDAESSYIRYYNSLRSELQTILQFS